MELVCWAAIGPSSAGRAVGMVPMPGFPDQPVSSRASASIGISPALMCVRSHSTAAPASSTMGTRASSVNRLASRKVASPGIRTNQVNGMITDSRTPCTTSASGT